MAAFIDENQQFIDPDTSVPIVNGEIFFGKQGADPVLNPITVFSDRGLTTGIGSSVLTDASGRPVQKVFIPGRYSFVVKNSAGVQKLIDLDAGSIAGVGVTVLTNVLGANDISAEADPVITELINGEQFTFTAIAINTDKMTLDVGTGAKAIKFNFNEEMAPGFIQKDQTVNLTYNSTTDSFAWDNEGRGISLLTNVAGDGNIITADGGPSVTGYVDKQIFIFRANDANTGAVTLKIGSLPVADLKKANNQALIAGEIITNQDVIVSFNSTSADFHIISQLSNQFFITSKMIIPFFGTNLTIPFGFVLCDGTNNTPNLLDKFIKGTSSDGLNVGGTGGSTTTGAHTLTVAQMPAHTHTHVTNSTQQTVTGGTPQPGDNMSNATSQNTGSTGGGGSHTHPGNEPPFLRLIWIMKT